MASAVVQVKGDDDESWLYGDAPDIGGGSGGQENATPSTSTNEVQSSLSADAAPFQPEDGEKTAEAENKEAAELEAGELSVEEGKGEKEGDNAEDEDSDDDDDDDDVQVTIGDIKPQTAYDTPKFKSGYQRTPVSGAAKPGQPSKHVDVEAQGTINGVPTYEFDLESLEERPWRKPGADITDYFNYGFNEDTWRQYCEKQRRLRMETGSKTGSGSGPFGSGYSNRSYDGPPSNNISLTSPSGRGGGRGGGGYKSNFQARNTSGAIAVIGGSTSRRPTARDYEEQAQPTENQEYKYQPIQTLGSGPTPVSMQDTSVPPPTTVPPPNYSVPPPVTVPPPRPVPPPHSIPPPTSGPPPMGPPPGYGGPPPGPGYYMPPPGMPPGPPDRGPPPPGYNDGPPPFGFHGPPGGPPPPGGPFGGPPHSGPPPNWNMGPPDPYNNPPPWGPYGPESDSDFSSSEDERDRFRGGRPDRDRGRDFYDPYDIDRRRSRSPVRDRDFRDRDARPRDRDERSQTRDRERRHKDREERHSRRSKRDEDDRHKSKHKKSKKSKKEKDGAPEGAPPSEPAK